LQSPDDPPSAALAFAAVLLAAILSLDDARALRLAARSRVGAAGMASARAATARSMARPACGGLAARRRSRSPGSRTAGFDLTPARAQELFDSGRQATSDFLTRWDFGAYKAAFRK
jgi:hypothetical protein